MRTAALTAAVAAAATVGLLAVSAVPTSSVSAPAEAASVTPTVLDTAGPGPGDNAVLQWNEEALTCVRVSGPGPTIVARALYVTHNAMYDAWTGYVDTAKPTVSKGWKRQPASARTDAAKVTAISHAAYAALTDLFPDQRCRDGFGRRLTALGQRADDSAAAAVEGRRAAGEVLAVAVRDGSNQRGDDPKGTPGVRYSDTTGYVPVNSPTQVVDPLRWQPLVVNGRTQQPLTPQWGQVTTFVPDVRGRSAQLQDPKKLSAAEVDELIRQVLADSAALDERAKCIAEYWANGPGTETPPGQWNVFAQWASRTHGQSLDTDVVMFFGLNGALHDAGVAAWRIKYRYDFGRPVTVVRNLRRGQLVTAWAGPGKGTQQIPGESWTPYQPVNAPTPAFPAYVSGHSTFSGAAAAYLTAFGDAQGRDGRVFGGSATIRPGSSVVEPGVVPAVPVTLSWATWQDAADQAGLSRRYGGIHWVIDDGPARELGADLGRDAFAQVTKVSKGA